MWSQRNKAMIVNMIYELRDELENYGFPVYEITEVRFTRAVNVFGSCTKDNIRKTAVISISEVCLHSLENTLRDTILHELCHAMSNTKGHDVQWKSYVSRVNSIYGTNIHRNVNKADAMATREYKESRYRYAVTCKKCGSTWKFLRKNKLVKQTMGEANYGYICSKCRDDYFECEDLTTGDKYVKLTIHTRR